MADLISLQTFESKIFECIEEDKHQRIYFAALDTYFENSEIFFSDKEGNKYLSPNIFKIIYKEFEDNNIGNYFKLKIPLTPIEIEQRWVFEAGERVRYEESDLRRNQIANKNNKKKDKPKEFKSKKIDTSKFEQNLIRFSKFLDKKIICFDTEYYEDDQDKMLELGYSFYNNGTIVSCNILIKENLKLKNGKYVPNNKDNFNFGETIIFTEEEAIKHILLLVEEADAILGHGVSSDLQIIPMEIKEKMEIFDTSKMFNFVEFGYKNNISLVNMCKELNITTTNLHNAGNDAHYTLQAALEYYSKSINTESVSV